MPGLPPYEGEQAKPDGKSVPKTRKRPASVLADVGGLKPLHHYFVDKAGSQAKAKAKSRAGGYDLSARRCAKRGYAKVAIAEESCIAPGERERFLRGTIRSRAHGGVHSHVIREVPATSIHWGAIRCFVFFVKQDAPVAMREALQLGNLQDYFRRLVDEPFAKRQAL